MSPPCSSPYGWSLSQLEEQSEADPRNMTEAGYNMTSSYMPEQGTTQSTEEPDSAEVSLAYRRQRDLDTFSSASSVISTGTRMSYRTIPQPTISEEPLSATQTHPGPIDIVLGQAQFLAFLLLIIQHRHTRQICLQRKVEFRLYKKLLKYRRMKMKTKRRRVSWKN